MTFYLLPAITSFEIVNGYLAAVPGEVVANTPEHKNAGLG
jgi:hypothetical protein